MLVQEGGVVTYGLLLGLYCNIGTVQNSIFQNQLKNKDKVITH